MQRVVKNGVILAIVAGILGLAACGETQSDRALSGAGIGAGVGALGAAALGGNALSGAALGGIVGAGTGALTSPRDIDLGAPWWR